MSIRAFVSVLALSLALAGAAQAQIDLESISFDRRVDRVVAGAVEQSASFTVTVRGSGLLGAMLVKPDETEILLSANPDGSLGASFDFDDEDDLDTDFPALGDTYVVSLNTGALEIEIDYEAPGLPELSITSPEHDSSNNSPTTTPFTFTPCPAAACSDTSDHVRALVTENDEAVASGIVDDPALGSWTPEDGDGVPLVLPEGANLTFNAQLRANRPDFRVVEIDDFYTFWNSFHRSDEVDFSTGFRGLDEAPIGSFSIDGADPSAFVITSGPVMTELGGVALDFDYSLDPKGKISGTGTADVNDDDLADADVEVKGKLKDKKGIASQKLTIKIKSKEEGAEASAKYTREEVLDRDGETSDRTEELKGKVLGVKVLETDAGIDSIAGQVSSWILEFDLSTEDGLRMIVSDAVLAIGAREVTLEGGGKYDADGMQTTLSMKSSGDDKGVSVKINKLTVDDENAVTGGTATVKAFGQSVEVELP